MDPTAFEVVVVEDGGPPVAEAIVAAKRLPFRCRVIRQSNQGPGAARNLGAGVALGWILAFTDDDCEPEPGWLDAMAVAIDGRPDTVFGGPVTNALPNDLFARTSHLILELAYAFQNRDPGLAEFVASNNMAMAATIFAMVGGFDPTFRIASEDRAFCARARELGLTIAIAANAAVRHLHHSSLAEFSRQHFRYGRGAWQYHALLRTRRRGRLMTDLRFHSQFLGMAVKRLRAFPLGVALRIAAMLAWWQLANALGFGYQALTRAKPARIRASQQP